MATCFSCLLSPCACVLETFTPAHTFCFHGVCAATSRSHRFVAVVGPVQLVMPRRAGRRGDLSSAGPGRTEASQADHDRQHPQYLSVRFVCLGFLRAIDRIRVDTP